MAFSLISRLIRHHQLALTKFERCLPTSIEVTSILPIDRKRDRRWRGHSAALAVQSWREGLTSSAKTKNPNYRLKANGILKRPRKRQIGTLRNSDGDGKGNSKKQLVRLVRKTTLHVHHAFWYISLPSLHNYDVK